MFASRIAQPEPKLKCMYTQANAQRRFSNYNFGYNAVIKTSVTQHEFRVDTTGFIFGRLLQYANNVKKLCSNR